MLQKEPKLISFLFAIIDSFQCIQVTQDVGVVLPMTTVVNDGQRKCFVLFKITIRKVQQIVRSVHVEFFTHYRRMMLELFRDHMVAVYFVPHPS